MTDPLNAFLSFSYYYFSLYNSPKMCFYVTSYLSTSGYQDVAQEYCCKLNYVPLM
jgi:hypothetical protein